MLNTKNCSRCAKEFESTKVDVKTEIKDFLSKTYYSYICDNCYFEIDKMFLKLLEYPSPIKGGSLIENVHYYIENGLWVFTEFYHFSRGFCCQNGCRHCAYNYKK